MTDNKTHQANKNWFVDNCGDVCVSEGVRIASVMQSAYTSCRDDAHLIATAPELLAVLEDVIYALSDTDGNGLLEYTHWMHQARAVIAKAKGEEVQDQLPF